MASIIHGDCLEEMKKLEDGSFDLIITSPPYNLRNTTGGFLKGKTDSGRFWKNCPMLHGYEDYEDNMPHEEYVEWQRACLKEMFRLISNDGAIFYNHKWRVQGGLLQDRSDIVSGFPVRQIIIWQRSGGLNFNDNYFLPTYEVIYLICKPKFKLRPTANKFGDIWKVNQDFDNPHPAPFPLEIPERIIISTFAKNVLDPFGGSGTTGVAAINCGIDYTLIEKSEAYCEMARNRIANLPPRLFKKELEQFSLDIDTNL